LREGSEVSLVWSRSDISLAGVCCLGSLTAQPV